MRSDVLCTSISVIAAVALFASYIETAANVPVLHYSQALTIEDTYRQIEALGAATGHADDAIAPRTAP